MPKINVLSRDISELIAAGEVIERPSSVIKELVENSIDAGASRITIEIKNGGTTYMRVTDDGCGIKGNQLPTAFLRHATSKITQKDDLDRIMTLGFRGEALASVSAVSKVEVLTKCPGDEMGTHYITEGSIEKLNETAGCPDGTTFIIRDIFYNVPVRRKFMKRDSAEANAVTSIVQKIVLSHPEISFKLIKDNKTEFTSVGDGKLYSAIFAIYGREFAHDLIPVDYSENGMTVRGYAVKPLYSRSNRSFQNFFINGRYVRSVTCTASLEEAYKTLIMVGKYPACVLDIELPPDTVDVNIHPSKAEVRFSDEKTVFNCLYFAVKSALMKSGLIYEFDLRDDRKDESFYKQMPFEPEKTEQITLPQKAEAAPVSPEEKEALNIESGIQSTPEPRIRPVSQSEFSADRDKEGAELPQIESQVVKLASPTAVKAMAAVQTQDDPDEDISAEIDEEELSGFSYINAESFEKTAEPEPVKKEEAEPIRVIGELFKNYILAQWGDSMVMIDKHAAHERTIFERLRKKCDSKDSQTLLLPREVLLSEREFGALEDNYERLESMGFRADFSNEPMVRILAVPIILQELDIEEVISEIAENFSMNKVDPQTRQLEDTLHDLACKAAIKANDKTALAELQALADEVIANEDIRHCPHGRPVMFVLTKRDIEKQFRRIV